MKPYIVSERNMFLSKQSLTPTAAYVNYSIQIKVRKYSTFHKHYKKLIASQKSFKLPLLFTETSKLKMAKIILMNCKL